MSASLEALQSDAIESDYTESHAHIRAASRTLVVTQLTALALAFLLGLAIRTTNLTAGQTQLTRQALLARVHLADSRVAATETKAREAARDLQAAEEAKLSGTSLGDQAAARVARLRAAAGFTAVSGPGVAVLLQDAVAPDGTVIDNGRVLDRDVQMVVNGLWQAGATAIEINGRRLTAATAIRSAGSAILVNYRPLVPPYRIRAIGRDADAIAGSFRESDAGLALEELQSKFAIVWEVRTLGKITISAATEVTGSGR